MRLWLISLCALLASCQSGQLSRGPDNYRQNFEQAVRQVESLNYTEAEKRLEDLASQYPRRPEIWKLLAGAYDLNRQSEDALDTFRKGLRKVKPSHPGYPDLALQAALFCVRHPDLECSPDSQVEKLKPDDPRRMLIAAAVELQGGDSVRALRKLNLLIEQKPPKSITSDLYYLAAQAYKQLDENMYVSESLFHAVNFTSDPIMIQRIEKLWKPDP